MALRHLVSQSSENFEYGWSFPNVTSKIWEAYVKKEIAFPKFWRL
jgi:hypothetical protein